MNSKNWALTRLFRLFYVYCNFHCTETYKFLSDTRVRMRTWWHVWQRRPQNRSWHLSDTHFGRRMQPNAIDVKWTRNTCVRHKIDAIQIALSEALRFSKWNLALNDRVYSSNFFKFFSKISFHIFIARWNRSIFKMALCNTKDHIHPNQYTEIEFRRDSTIHWR